MQRGWRSARWDRPAEVAVATRPRVEATLAAPAVDVSSTSISLRDIVPSFGVFCLLLFCFVILSARLPLGEAAAIGALLAMLGSKSGMRLPRCYAAYLGYVGIATAGLFFSSFKGVVFLELQELFKIAVIGLSACTILGDLRAVRGFTFGYLALYAIFPIRGAIYNYMNGITHGGRINWNFIFENSNDLALLTILPMGMCGYFLMSEKKGVFRHAAAIGLVVTTLVVLLTESRGAILGLGAGLLYFFARTKKRGQAMIVASIGLVVAGSLAPSSVWTRLGGLANISFTGGMKGVDKESSAESRWAIMGVGLKIASDNPALGVGIGVYPTAHYMNTMRGEVIPSAAGARDAHSSYVRAAAETGFFGAACIIAFILLAWREVSLTRAALPERYAHYKHALMALEVSLVAFAFAAIFGSAERLTFFLLQVLIPYCAAAALRNELLRGGRAPARA